MNKYSYFRETYNCLTQFVAAFDDCFVYRYTKDFQQKEKINVRYVMGPKQRVLYDIVNPSKNITVPVIAMEQTNLKRDSSRIQFKDQNIIRHHINDKNISKIPMPIPVTMDINVSIVANYKEDIDQIVSNFVPWCNPYFVISWKIPEEFGLDFIDELRTEVTWSGSIDYENPININNGDKYKIIGNTSFTIKGWIFPALETPAAPIYVVTTNFIAVSSGTILNGYDSYWSLSASDTTDVIMISAYPEFTNCFINGRAYHSLSLNNLNDQTFTFYGKRFDFNNYWYLSSNIALSGFELQEIDTAKFPTISAYRIPDNLITTINDNIVSINFPYSGYNLYEGNYTFVTSNSAGWASSCGITRPADIIYVSVSEDLVFNGIIIEYNGESIIYSTTVPI